MKNTQGISLANLHSSNGLHVIRTFSHCQTIVTTSSQTGKAIAKYIDITLITHTTHVRNMRKKDIDNKVTLT